ncbi:MAG: hypothetical protein JWP63_2885, partial [Candidatus Solibacter sp.]|nr:hypothetical protein [Candidatus Solibacter sp.]
MVALLPARAVSNEPTYIQFRSSTSVIERSARRSRSLTGQTVFYERLDATCLEPLTTFEALTFAARQR